MKQKKNTGEKELQVLRQIRAYGHPISFYPALLENFAWPSLVKVCEIRI